MSDVGAVRVRPLAGGDAAWARALLAVDFGSGRVVSRGRLYQADALPGFVGEYYGAPAALLTYDIRDRELQVVTVQAAVRRCGLGAALLDAAVGAARAAGCRRVWLITTNDNAPALAFYRRRGWRIAAVHVGAVAAARRLKPEIPLIGRDGVPIRDEVEFEVLIEA